MPFGDVIKTYREKLGISQNELAKRTNISQGTLSRIEANLQKPNTNNLVRIAKAMGTSIDELLQTIEGENLVMLQEREKILSSFLEELQRLEPKLTTQQRNIVLKIAHALALETSLKQSPIRGDKLDE